MIISFILRLVGAVFILLSSLCYSFCVFHCRLCLVWIKEPEKANFLLFFLGFLANYFFVVVRRTKNLAGSLAFY